MHPATWFKVEFGDNKIVTFRPSALQPLDDNGQPLASYTVKPSITKAHKEKVAVKSPAGKKPRHDLSDPLLINTDPILVRTEQERLASRTEKKILLSNIDPDTWVGKKVVLMGGRNSGQEGLVKSSGNGWVQIDTHNGEIAKRAYELEVLLEGADLERHRAGKSLATTSAPSSQSNRKRNRANSDLSEVSDMGSGRGKSSRFQFQDFYDEEEPLRHDESYYSNYDYDRIRYQKQFYQITKRSRFSEYETKKLEELAEERKKLPLINEKEMQEKRSFTLKYVQKLQSNLGNRPNLQEWKHKINTSLVAPLAKFYYGQNFCNVCSLEKWPDSHYCWNEFCPVSPAYFKLNGLDEESEEEIPVAVSTMKESLPSAVAAPVDDETDQSVGDDEDDEKTFLPASQQQPVFVKPNPVAYNRDRAESMATDIEENSPYSVHEKGLPLVPNMPLLFLPPNKHLSV